MKKPLLILYAVGLLLVPLLRAGEVDYVKRGHEKYDKHDLAGAMADYQKAITLHPNDPEGYNSRGNVRHEKGDLKGAVADYTKAIELKPDLAQAYYNRGYTRIDLGELPDALNDLNKAIELQPDDAETYACRGLAKLRSRDYAGAAADSTKAIELNPRFADAYYNRGLAKLVLADNAGAMPDLNRAIELQPQNADAYLYRSLLNLRQTNSASALADATKAIQLKPDSTFAYYYRGLAKRDTGDTNGALADFNEAIDLEPDNTDAFFSRAGLKEQKADMKGALADYNRAIILSPTNATFYIHRGNFNWRRGDLDAALTDLSKAIELAPEDFGTYLLRGDLKGARGEFTAAIADFDKVIALRPNEGLGYLMRGKARAELGDVPGALADYNKALELKKGFEDEPGITNTLERFVSELKLRLKPQFIIAEAPRTFSENELQNEMLQRLPRDEARRIVNPMAATPAMTNWAVQLTRGATNDIVKARKLFDALTRHVSTGEGGTRTAPEVFAAWKDLRKSFSCQEYAKLYVALARTVGVKAFYVHLERDHAGKVVYHDCASVFADGKALLVDPAYVWFGVPHREFVILNDVQAVAHHYFQHGNRKPDDEVSRCLIAVKLHPNFAWGELCLANAYWRANENEKALAVLNTVFLLETNRWDAWQLRGDMALWSEHLPEALTALQKASELNPGNGKIREHMGLALAGLGRLNEAREEFSAALLAGLDSEDAREARQHLAKLDASHRSVNANPHRGRD